METAEKIKKLLPYFEKDDIVELLGITKAQYNSIFKKEKLDKWDEARLGSRTGIVQTISEEIRKMLNAEKNPDTDYFPTLDLKRVKEMYSILSEMNDSNTLLPQTISVFTEFTNFIQEQVFEIESEKVRKEANSQLKKIRMEMDIYIKHLLR